MIAGLNVPVAATVNVHIVLWRDAEHDERGEREESERCEGSYKDW